MRRRGLDGLAAQLPINVYYLTDYWSQLMAAQFDWSCFAVLPRDSSRPSGLVLPALDLRNLVSDGTWVQNIVTYTDAPPPGSAATAGGGIPYGGWPTRPGVALSELAKEWLGGLSRWCASTSASATAGLVRALRDAGLERAVVGVDDERLASVLPAAGLPDATVVYAREAFNEIRLIKTEEEIALLRAAAEMNERAVLAAASALRLGATWDELVRRYMTEMAAHGGTGIYLACGSGGLPHRSVVAGEPMMFDGLGRYRGYHGDFGRSAVVGEPSRQVVARVKALQAGWETAYQMIRPGVRFSEIKDAVSRAVKAAGFDGAFRPPVPHNLGLEHTDDPRPLDLPANIKPEQTLEAGMVINVDMPHIEIGWGAIHLEDTVRITAEGCEPLTSMQTDLIMIAA